MTKATLVIRIYLKDLRIIRSIFKAEREETACSYFKRLAEYLKNDK